MDDDTSLSICREVVVYYSGKISDHRSATRTNEISQLAGGQWVSRAGRETREVKWNQTNAIESRRLQLRRRIRSVFSFSPSFLSVCHAKRSNWEFVVGLIESSSIVIVTDSLSTLQAKSTWLGLLVNGGLL